MRDIGMEVCLAARRVFSTRQLSAIIVLSIGLILATVMFAVGRGYSVYGIPYKNADELVSVEITDDRILNSGTSTATNASGKTVTTTLLPAKALPTPQRSPSLLYFICKERTDIFTETAAYDSDDTQRVGTASGNRVISLVPATPNFFDMLGISFPGLAAWKADAETKNPFPVIAMDALARKLGDTATAKKFSIQDGTGFTVTGVLPTNFVFPLKTATYAAEYGFKPLTAKEADTVVHTETFTGPDGAVYGTSSRSEQFYVIGRLKPGVTPQAAEQMLASEMTKIEPILNAAKPLSKMFPSAKKKIAIKPLKEMMTHDSRRVVLGAWILSGLIILICAANLAGMFLVRCSYQLREYALRNALGANLVDLSRLLSWELAVMGITAVVIAWFGARSTVAAIADFLPVQYLAFGQPDCGSAALLFLLSGAVFILGVGGLPVFAVLVRNYRRGFSSDQRAMFARHRTTRILLTAGQTALALLLLGMTYMTVRGYIDLFSTEIGINPDTRILSVSYSPELAPDRVGEIVSQTLAGINGGNTKTQAGALQATLFQNGISSVMVLGSKGNPVLANPIGVSPGFFQAVNGKILAGREYRPDDVSNPVLINRAMAQEMGWSPQEAIRQTSVSFSEIIGVVENFPTVGLDVDERPGLISRYPAPSPAGGVYSNKYSVVVHYMLSPEAAARVGSIEKEILKSDPDAVIFRKATMGSLLRTSVQGRIFATFAVVLFAFCAVGIVVTNIVSTVAFIIGRRTRDIAIYIALGIPSRAVRWVVMKDMVLAGVGGVLIGGLVSWWVGKAVAHFIYNGDKHQNPLGLALTAAALLVVITLAAWIPATRALRIEPNTALHAE
ncbi:MAG: ABC transporter permease [Acidobacteriota bacterium]|nr:ABC transporter permease [Acidobacteriota bacterium]